MVTPLVPYELLRAFMWILCGIGGGAWLVVEVYRWALRRKTSLYLPPPKPECIPGARNEIWIGRRT